MATDEILDVGVFSKDTDGTGLVLCPHCKRVLGLESGPIRGEQFFDKVCGGWLQVEDDAKRISLEAFEKLTNEIQGGESDEEN